MAGNGKEKYGTFTVIRASKNPETRVRQRNLVDRLRRFLRELKKVYNINVAAENAGLAVETVYYMMQKDENFRRRVQEIRSNVRGRVEARLTEEALAGKSIPMIYWLKNNTEKYREPSKKDLIEAAKNFFLPWAPAQVEAPKDPGVIEGEVRVVND